MLLDKTKNKLGKIFNNVSLGKKFKNTDINGG